jgi:type I restriction enzyme S subunit
MSNSIAKCRKKAEALDWLSIRAENWAVLKLKYICDYKVSNVDKKSDDNEVPVRLCNYTDVYNNEFINLNLNFMEVTASVNEIEKYRLNIGDVIITKDSESWNDIAIPALVCEEAVDLVCGYHLALIRPSGKILGQYLFRLLQSHPINTQFQIAANGITRYGLSIYGAKNVYLPLPPPATQKAIVAFLDEKTAQIDDIIDKKQKLLELLGEQRNALINQAVTKGLDPDAPMKDTSIPWIGEIPSHWEVVRLKFLKSGAFRYGANESADNFKEGEPRYIRITDINDDGSLRTDSIRSLPLDVAKPYLLHEGDILFARSGATVGKSIRYRDTWGTCCFAGYLIKMSVNKRLISSSFVELFTRSSYYMSQVNQGLIQATIQNVSAERYGEFQVAVPPLNEQHSIVNDIGQVLERCSILHSITTSQVEKLQEYRQALITAAVTGQLDIMADRGIEKG